jgi:hypothetical protein
MGVAHPRKVADPEGRTTDVWADENPLGDRQGKAHQEGHDRRDQTI